MVGFSRTLFLLLAVASCSACAPHLDDIYFISEVKGVVVQGGVPVKNAVVTRTYQLGDYTQAATATTTTDDQGYFVLPAGKEYRFFLSIGEVRIKQEIIIKADNHPYVGWRYIKDNLRENGEIDQPISLVCDIDTEVQTRMLPSSFGIKENKYFGMCDVAPDRQ